MHNHSPVEFVYYAHIKANATKAQVLILKMCLYLDLYEVWIIGD